MPFPTAQNPSFRLFQCFRQRHVPTLWHYRFEKFDAAFYQEIMLSSGVFRRETASGFYPWGKVESPRKRVAEGLCGWRHGNSFPMTQSAQSHRQKRSIPLCPKAVFYVFVFGSIHDSGNNAESIPRNVPLNRDGCFLCFGLVGMDFRQKCSIFRCRMKKGWGSFCWGSWFEESGISL